MWQCRGASTVSSCTGLACRREYLYPCDFVRSLVYILKWECTGERLAMKDGCSEQCGKMDYGKLEHGGISRGFTVRGC